MGDSMLILKVQWWWHWAHASAYGH